MKKFLVWLLSIVTALFCLVGCATPDEFETSHTITYYAVIDGTQSSVPAGMYVKDGSYPSSYIVGVGATVDDLQTYVEGDVTYTFEGWFTNKSCETAFTGVGKTAEKDVVIYAKVTKTTEPETPQVMDIEYYSVIDGTVGSIPAAMYDADTSKYPATYVVGVGAKIGDLNSTDKYTFVGWYTDGECKTAFTEIDTNATEKVVVYAKITSVQDPEEDINNDKDWTKNY